MKKPQIAKCACGHSAKVDSWGETIFIVACSWSDVDCWAGPICKTKSGAIKAWNKVMGEVK